MTYLIIWVIFGIITAMIGSSKGRSGCSYFLLGVLLGPLGIILALVTKTDHQAVERDRISTGLERKCPMCAELVKAEAVLCKHCGSELPKIEKPVSPPLPTKPWDLSEMTQKCLGCGVSYQYGAKLCPECGVKSGRKR